MRILSQHVCSSCSVFASLLFLFSRIQTSSAQEVYTKESIEKAWKEREEFVRSARFDWIENQTDAKGVISDHWKKHDRKLKTEIPPEDTTFTNQSSAVIDGGKIRYGYKSVDWSTKTNAYETLSYLTAFDGSNSKELWEYGENHSKSWPQAIIRGAGSHANSGLARLAPILVTVRGGTSGMQPQNLDNYEITGQTLLIGNRLSIELRQRIGPTSVENRLWLDPSRDFVLVRMVRSEKGIVTTKLDIMYEHWELRLWLPKKWELVHSDANGALTRSYSCHLTDFEINPKVPGDLFDLQFPNGTRVHDAKRQEDYIVKMDGSGKRMIPREDFGASYEQMLKTEPGKAHAPGAAQAPAPRSEWFGYVLAACAAVTLCIGLIVFASRRLNPPRHPKEPGK